MKIFNLKYIVLALAVSISFTSCEDDEALSAGNGDPLNEANIVEVDATVSTTSTAAGEGDRIPFDVTLSRSFESDATVTVSATLDNGRQTTGTAVVPAGSTSGSGSVVLPGDDAVNSGSFEGNDDAATLEATAILLDDLVPDTTFIIGESNEAKFDILDRTLDVAGGLNVLLDWENPAENDYDMYIEDEDGNVFESAESGSRYEVDLFQNAEREDGTYFVVVGIFATTEGPVDWRVALTRPDGFVDIYTGTFEDPQPGDFYTVVEFTKSTNEETGVISYSTSEADED